MSEKLNKKGLERLWDKILLLADYIQGKISALEKSMPEQAKNGKLTIQKNGTEVQTFSANQGTDATANILVPTISNSAAVTQTGQMALDATEKNASIEGTLAHQIAQVNSNIIKKIEVIPVAVTGTINISSKQNVTINTTAYGFTAVPHVWVRESGMCTICITNITKTSISVDIFNAWGGSIVANQSILGNLVAMELS